MYITHMNIQSVNENKLDRLQENEVMLSIMRELLSLGVSPKEIAEKLNMKYESLSMSDRSIYGSHE
tara:strand:- start:2137 stop:2334 length:198 start_codon:yes stop_codon:yes gene_type:complete